MYRQLNAWSSSNVEIPLKVCRHRRINRRGGRGRFVGYRVWRERMLRRRRRGICHLMSIVWRLLLLLLLRGKRSGRLWLRRRLGATLATSLLSSLLSLTFDESFGHHAHLENGLNAVRLFVLANEGVFGELESARPQLARPLHTHIDEIAETFAVVATLDRADHLWILVDAHFHSGQRQAHTD